MSQAVAKLEVQLEHEVCSLPRYNSIAHDRDKIVRDVLKMQATLGKELLTNVAGGSNIEEKELLPEAIEFLNSLRKEAKFLRWLACSVRRDVYNTIRMLPKRGQKQQRFIIFGHRLKIGALRSGATL